MIKNYEFELVGMSENRRAIDKIEQKKNFDKLSSIKIVNCKLSKFPNKNFVKLVHLDLTSNLLEEIPSIDENNLETLNMSCNKIRQFDISKISKCAKLRSLNLSKNLIDDLKDNDKLLPKSLEILELYQNNIKSADPLFKNLTSEGECNIRYLDLSSNSITHLPEQIKFLCELTKLLMNNTEIDSINYFIELKKLSVLGLIGTKITRLTKEFACLPLNEVYLNETKMEYPPLSCVNKGFYSIKEFFNITKEDIAKGVSQITSSKLLAQNNVKDTTNEDNKSVKQDQKLDSSTLLHYTIEDVEGDSKDQVNIKPQFQKDKNSFITSMTISISVNLQHSFIQQLNKKININSVYSIWREVESTNPTLIALYHNLRAKMAVFELKQKLIEIRTIIDRYIHECNITTGPSIESLTLSMRKTFEYMIDDTFYMAIKKYNEILLILKQCHFKATCKKGEILYLIMEKNDRNLRRMVEMQKCFIKLTNATDPLKLIGM